MAATIRDVAQRAGVSLSTVSSVVNGNKYVSPQLRSRVEQAILDLDYIPNYAGRALSSRRTSTIAYMIPTITGAFNPIIIETVESTAAQLGFGLIICNIERDVERAEKAQAFLLGTRVDGIIISPTGAVPNEMLVSPFLKRNIPVVVLAGPRPVMGVDSFIADNEHAAEALARYIIGMGHKDIMFIGRKASATTNARLDGLTRALNNAGITLPDTHVMRAPGVTVPYTDIVNRLLHLPSLPTAVVCQSDSIAVSVIRACYYLGLRVPEDITVTGWDDTIGDDCIPPLTTMAVPAKEMGRQATEALITRITNKAMRADDYFKVSIDRGRYPYPNGPLYTLWTMMSPTFVYYNQDLFDQVGLQYPTENWTYTEDVPKIYAKMARDTNGDGIIDQYGFPLAFGDGTGRGGYGFGAVRLSFGASDFNDSYTAFALNTPENIKAFEYTFSFRDMGQTKALKAEDFQKGIIGAYFYGAWLAPRLSQGTFRWGTAFPPKGPAGRFVPLHGNPSMVIAANTPYKEAAWKFVSHVLKNQTPTSMYLAGNMPTKRKAALEWINRGASLWPGFRPDAAQASIASSVFTPAISPLQSKAQDAIAAVIQKGQNGEMPWATALNEATRLGNAILAGN